MVCFGDVVRDVMVRVDPETSGLERYIAGEHLESDDLHIRRWGTVGDGYLGPAFYRKFVKGQVLYLSRRPYLRKMGLAQFDGITGEKTFVLEPKGDDLLPEFLPFVMQTERFTEHAVKNSIGSVNPHVRFRDLASYEFALPPKEEQLRIAAILAAVDDGVEAFTKANTNFDALRKATLVRLVTRGTSPKRLVKTKLGFLPDDWEVVRVDEAGEVQLGRQRAPRYQTGLHRKPYLRVANVYDGYLDLTDVLEMDFDDTDFAAFSLRPGDILLNEGQSRELVGRSCIYRGEIEDCCFQNTLIRFRPSVRILPEFALAYFQHALYAGLFARIARQTTSIAHLGADRFSHMLIPLPPLDVQERVVQVVKAMSRAASSLTDRIRGFEGLKQRLSDYLLHPRPK
jgi:type I restriction enzyme S subunit